MFVIVLYCSLSRDIIKKFFKHLYKKEDMSCNLIDKGMVSDIIHVCNLSIDFMFVTHLLLFSIVHGTRRLFRSS
jgi:hypothetical protein